VQYQQHFSFAKKLFEANGPGQSGHGDDVGIGIGGKKCFEKQKQPTNWAFKNAVKPDLAVMGGFSMDLLRQGLCEGGLVVIAARKTYAV
jgi:hypothetical protein